MKKKCIVLLLLMMTLVGLYCQELIEVPDEQEAGNFSPQIGVVFPYIINKTTGTFFYNEHFLFEILSNPNSSALNINIVNVETDGDEVNYLENCRLEVIRSNYDYLLYSKVYSIDNHVFLDVKLLNPYKNEILYSKNDEKKV